MLTSFKMFWDLDDDCDASDEFEDALEEQSDEQVYGGLVEDVYDSLLGEIEWGIGSAGGGSFSGIWQQLKEMEGQE